MLMKNVGAVRKENPDRRVAMLMRFRRRLADTPDMPANNPQYQGQPYSFHQGDWTRLNMQSEFSKKLFKFSHWEFERLSLITVISFFYFNYRNFKSF